MSPLVSIVIPCYKGSRFLAEAIESCLQQTYAEFEVIVVDDASPENDGEIADRFAARDTRVRVLRHPVNGAVSRAFNTGFHAAQGDLFTRLAQDDRFRNDALAIMVRRLEAEPDVGLVYCNMQLIDANGQYLLDLRCEEPKRALLPCDRMGVCVLWRRTVWQAVGPFNPRFDTAEDYEFFLRVSRRFRIQKCGEEAPFFFRYHPNQGGIRFEKKQNAASMLAQLSHNWATVKSHPTRIGSWKGIVGCGGKLILHKLIYRLTTSR
jgi:glycosyltransferase involved in cell wall biosynthesis